jgi:hypothetical protein
MPATRALSDVTFLRRTRFVQAAGAGAPPGDAIGRTETGRGGDRQGWAHQRRRAPHRG